MQGKKSQLIPWGEAHWGLPPGTFRAAWEEYQKGTTIRRVLAAVNLKRDPTRKRVPRIALLAEWNARGLIVDTRLWKNLRGYQWLRIQSLARMYRLPHWAIVYAALRAAEKDPNWDPTIELVEAGIPRDMLLARRAWWAPLVTPASEEREHFLFRKGAPGLNTDSELSRKMAGIHTPRGGRLGRHQTKRRKENG